MRSIGRIVAVTAMLTAVLFASPSTTPASGQQNSVSGTIQDGDMALDFTLNGGSITSAVPDGHYYTIEGTVRHGETISIAATARSIARDPASPNEPQAASFDIIVDGSDVHEHETLPPGEGGSLAASYIVPDDEWKVRGTAMIGQTWVNPYGGGSLTLRMEFELEVVEPVTTTTRPSGGSSDTIPQPEPPEDEDCEVPDDYYTPTPGSGTSIVKFGDLHGEVNVRPNCADDDAYIFAELDTPLHHDDRIRALRRSGAILSFSDMSTFVLREDTTIVLDIANVRESKLGLVAGRMWVNFQRMLEGQDLEVEMAQAVAGIKATTFIVEETGAASVVKVFEGNVEVRAKAGGTVDVGPGTMVEVTADGAGPVTDFDIDAELADWDEQVRETTRTAVATGGEPGGGSGTPVAVIAVVVVAVVIALAALVLRQRRTTLHDPTPF